jgi:hypothetical protein
MSTLTRTPTRTTPPPAGRGASAFLTATRLLSGAPGRGRGANGRAAQRNQSRRVKREGRSPRQLISAGPARTRFARLHRTSGKNACRRLPCACFDLRVRWSLRPRPALAPRPGESSGRRRTRRLLPGAKQCLSCDKAGDWPANLPLLRFNETTWIVRNFRRSGPMRSSSGPLRSDNCRPPPRPLARSEATRAGPAESLVGDEERGERCGKAGPEQVSLFSRTRSGAAGRRAQQGRVSPRGPGCRRRSPRRRPRRSAARAGLVTSA